MSTQTVKRQFPPPPVFVSALSLAVITLAACILYLMSRSASLDDFDSYSFVLALDRFDIALQQPQPPGFPVYVALGRGVQVFVPDARLALTTLSAVSGALAVGLVFWLARLLFRRDDLAVAAAAIFAVSPIQWLASGKALSDVPGLALSLAAVGMVWAGRRDRRWLVGGAILLGLSTGTRPQANLPGLLLFVWILWKAARASQWRTVLLASGAFCAAVAVWLVPTVASTGGLRSYYDLNQAHSRHVWESDSLFGAGPVSITTLRARVKDFLDTFLIPTLGISVYDDLATSDYIQLLLVALWLGGGAALADYRRHENRLLVVWLLLAVVPLFLLESLNRPRLMLPVLPPLFLLTVGGWGRFDGRRRAVAWGMWSAAFLAMATEGAPLASTLADQKAPPAQAIDYIQTHYPAPETMLAAAGSFRAAQVELPGYPLFYLYAFDAEAAASAVNNGTYRYIAVLDREMFGSVISILDGNGRYVPVEDRLFTRDPRVHWQHSQVRLQVLTPLAALTPAQLRLPDNGIIDLGGEDDGRFLGQGWFRSEPIGGAQARWAGDSPTSTLRVSLEPDTPYRATFHAAAYPLSQTVVVSVDGQPVAEIELVQDWREYTFTIAPEQVNGADITTIDLHHTILEAPYERTQGGSSDQRQLAAAYDWMQFVPEQEPQ